MAYKIQYEPEKNIKYPSRSRKGIKTIGVFIIAVLLTVSVGVLHRADLLLPVGAQATAAAFSKMIDTVREGENVKEAITAFCIEVLENGEGVSD